MSRAELPAALDAVVEGRGSALFRTAVLLRHDRDAAIRLVARAIATAARGRRRHDGSPEARVRDLMVVDFVASSRKQSATPEAAADADALADPLSGTSARGRALLVLGAHHQLSPERSARVLGVSTRRAITERQRALDLLGVDEISELSGPLGDVAESYTPPDSATLRRLVVEHRPRLGGRWRAGWAALAAVGVIGTVALAVTNDPSGGLSETVDVARFDADYASEYGLIDGRPRPFVDGLKLEKTVVIDYSQRRAIIGAPEVDDDTQLYAVAYCDLPGNAMDVDAVVNAVSLEAVPTFGETDVVDLSCLDRATDLTSSPLAKPLPRGVDQYAVTVPTVWTGTGALYLALYSEADWSAYPFPPFDTDLAPPAKPRSGQVIDADTPLSGTDELGWLTQDSDAQVHSVEVDVATALQLTMLTDEPGQLLIALDGVVVTNDGEELIALGEGTPGPWQQADPALRQGFWRGYSAFGDHRYLDSAMLSRLGVDITDDRVVISVISRGFNGDGWQVIATSDAGRSLGGLATLAPGYASTLPVFALGLERVGAYSVPTDGRPYEVPLAANQVDEFTFIGACDVETSHSIRTVTLRSPTRFGLIPCASYRNEWTAPLTPDIVGPEITASTETPEVITLTAPDTGERESLTIGVYRDVPFEDFPFGQGYQPSTAQLNLRPVPDEGDLIGLGWVSGGTSWHSVDQISATDLDVDGRATLKVPTKGQALVSVSTSGTGRFRVSTVGPDGTPLDGNFQDPSVLGRVASPLMYRDGWWTSWTAEPTLWTIPIPAGQAQREAGLEVDVQGYDAGILELSVLVAGPAERDKGAADKGAAGEGADDAGGDETLAP